MATGRANVQSLGVPDRGRDAAASKFGGKDIGIRSLTANEVALAKRVPGDKVYVRQATQRLQQFSQLARDRQPIVDILQQHIFEADAAIGPLDVVTNRFHELVYGKTLIVWHQLGAKLIAGGVERHRQINLPGPLGKLSDLWHDTDGRNRDPAVTQPDAGRVSQTLYGTADGERIEKRLAHSHEHHVRHALPSRSQAVREVRDLVHDLRGGKIPSEATQTGRAEGTGGRATDLRRYADGLAIPSFAARTNQNRLNTRPVAQSEEDLLGSVQFGRQVKPCLQSSRWRLSSNLRPELARQR